MSPIELPKLSVRSTTDLLAAVPYLLGFHPSESVVVIAFRGPRVVFAARGDLPDPASAELGPQAAAAHIAAVVARQGADAATVIGYGPAERVTPFVTEVGTALESRGVRVIDTLRVTDGRFWSYVCDDPGCCPPEGTPFDPSTSHIAAAATLAGQVALPDRATFVRRLDPVTGPARESMSRATERAEERLATLLTAAPAADRLSGRTLRVVGTAAVREAMDRHRDGCRLTDDELAWLSVLVSHVVVRDYAWERIGDEPWHVELWTDVVRRAEPQLVAAPASLLAFAAWRIGHGALANLAVERALACDPGYSMAQLMSEALQRGLPPETLIEPDFR